MTTAEQYGLLPGEEPLFQFCRFHSDDDFHRGEVYADWLEERGDPRSELLRLDVWVRENAKKSTVYGKHTDEGQALLRFVRLTWKIEGESFSRWLNNACLVLPNVHSSGAVYRVRWHSRQFTNPQAMGMQHVPIDLPMTDETREVLNLSQPKIAYKVDQQVARELGYWVGKPGDTNK